MPDADLLPLLRTTAIPLATFGATIAALTGSHPHRRRQGFQRARGSDSAVALISTIGVMTRDHEGDLPTGWVPELLLMRAARLIENTVDLVHQRLPATTGSRRERPAKYAGRQKFLFGR